VVELRKAGIKIIGVPGAIIYHGALDLRTDLRSAFRYGIGGAIAAHLSTKLADVPRSFFSTLKSQGIIPALYMIFRNRFYTVGYFYQKAKYLLIGNSKGMAGQDKILTIEGPSGPNFLTTRWLAAERI